MEEYRFIAAEASGAARAKAFEPYQLVFRKGELELGYYTPTGVDEQHPHIRDEVYVVVSGSGRFFNGGDEVDFGPGDALFVPAGVEHRFLDFTDDFETWVIFYGSEIGG